MAECPEFEDKEIPDDCSDCELYSDGCTSAEFGKLAAYLPICPYKEEGVIPEACNDCEYFDGYSCFHPKKS